MEGRVLVWVSTRSCGARNAEREQHNIRIRFEAAYPRSRERGKARWEKSDTQYLEGYID